MSNFKIKETYLLFLIVIGLISLAGYSTYALFTTSTEIEDVVEFSTSISTNNSIVEYEMVTVPAGETKIIELNVTNSYSETLYYGAWYEMVNPSTINDDIELGLYTDKNSTAGSGTITSGITLNLLVGITNNTSSDVIINIGTVGSLTSSLGLEDTRTLIPSGWSEALIVTDEVLAQYTTTVTNQVNLTYSYTGAKKEVTLNPGTYKLEVWGAQGGSYSTTYYGGKGGYSYGTLLLTESTDIFVYVGGQGTSSNASAGTFAGGFNGGGTGYSTSAYYAGAGGGGASDIRIGQDSLYARVIVAGGGGGAGSYSSTSTRKYIGGVGGGTSGGTGNQYSTSYKAGTGGSATAAGTSYYGTTTNSTSYGTVASFGTGGGSTSTNGIAGGGGGWYGGGYGRRSSGGGGSGYVYTSSTYSNCPTGCLLNSSYYLTDAATIAGNTSFTDFDGSNVTGHSGDGAIRIKGTTKEYIYSIPRVLGLTDITLKLSDSFDLTSGVILECAEGDDGCSITGTSISDWTTLPSGTNVVYYIVEDGKGKKYKYPRNITIEWVYEYSSVGTTALTLNTGTYKLEVWGAQGRTFDPGTYPNRNVGGKGGYSYGILNLNTNTPAYIYVGGMPTSVTDGGFNGGGSGETDNSITASAVWGRGGGGGTDIRIGTDSLYARVIVAGGGSGSSAYDTSSGSNSHYKEGFYGGGVTSGAYNSTYQATQVKAGAGGSFGLGGSSEDDGTTSNGYEASCGGGGGWYGGGSRTSSYGYYCGGGSGWVYTEATFNTWKSGNSTDANKWLLNTTYYLTDAATIAGDQSFTDFDGSTVTGHSGDGAVRITKIS